jgi:hypothetical protein
MNNNIAPMPTQNPWAWVGMGTQRRALVLNLRIHPSDNVHFVDDVVFFVSWMECIFRHDVTKPIPPVHPFLKRQGVGVGLVALFMSDWWVFGPCVG